MSKTQAMSQLVLDHQLGVATWTAPAGVFVGLSTTAIAEDGTGATEPPGANGYARQNAGAAYAAATTTATGATSANTAALTYGPNTNTDWGTITHFFFSDAVTGGTILRAEALTTPRAVAVNDSFEFAIGALVATES